MPTASHFHRPGHRLATALLLKSASLAYATAICADEQPDLFDEEVPVILSASRLIQPLSSSPASITVIDSEMIRLSGARTVVDVLRLVPGFQVGRLVNGNPIATYNGISERYNPRLQLIVDGRPTYVPLYGGIPWSELPVALSDIDRVEVTRAPNAATFGPNSFAAVVSIITRAPASRSGWSTNAEAGGNDFRSGTLSYHGGKDDLHYRVTLQGERDQGFRDLPDRERSELASIRTHWQINPENRLAVDIGGIQGGHTELDSVVEPNDLVGYTDTTNAYTQLVWEQSHSTDDTLKVQYYYNYFDIKDDNLTTFNLEDVTGEPAHAGLTIDAPINRDSRSTRHELEVQKTRRLNDDHRIVFGGALRQDSVKGHFLFNDLMTRYVSTQRLFAHSEYNIAPHWLLNSGLMLENHSIGKVSASPRISLSHRHAPGHTFRLGYSRGTRTPLLLEEDGNVQLQYPVSDGSVVTDLLVIDERDMTRETIDVIDFGYYYNNVERDLSVDLKLSWHDMQQLIGTRFRRNVEGDNFDGIARSYDNRFNYRFSSLEAQIDHRPTRRSLIRAAYAYTFDEDNTLQPRGLLPRNTLTLFGSVTVGNDISLSGEYYHTSNWIWDDVRDTSRLNRLDLRIEKGLKLGGLKAFVALQAELDLGGTTDYLERNRIDDLYFARLNVALP